MSVLSNSEFISGPSYSSWHGEMLIVLMSALIVHFIFNRWEHTSIPIVLALLVFIPGALSVMLIPRFGISVGVFVTFALYLSSLVTSVVLYRLSPFHPMAHYPGPTLAKISKLYMVYVVRKGSPWLWVQKQHRQYGDVIRIGPNEISVTDVDAILPMMGAQGMSKGPSWSGRAMHPKVLSLIASRDPVEHARRRRPWNRAFSTSALKEYEPMLKKRGSQLVEALGKQQGVVDLSRWITYFSYDFMEDMVFGGGTELLRDGDSEGLSRMLSDGLGMSLIYDQMPWISHYTKRIHALGKKHKNFHSMALNRTRERYQKGSTIKDLFYYLSNEDGAEKESPSPAVVISDGVLALVAGSETTAGTLRSAFFCLLRHPDAYERLQAEVDKYYPRGEDSLSTTHHQEMSYLTAVINETLRLYPVLPGGSQRAPQLGKGDRVIGKYYIPEGNQARINFYSIQRDPRYFSYPEKFWPDRWLIAEGSQEHPEKVLHEPRAFIPFSFGPSNCVGKHLAMQNLRMIMCHIMQKLEISLPEGRDSQTFGEQFAHRMGELPVVIRCRD